MPVLSNALTRWWHRHRHHHPWTPARAITTLGLTKVSLTFTPQGKIMSTVQGQFTAPTSRKSGQPLALTDIDHFSLTRNGTEIAKLPPSGTVINFTDSTPLTGTDTYDVFTITKDNFISDTSNDAAVIVATADPAAAVTDLTATLVP